MAFSAGHAASGVILRRRSTEGWSIDRGAIGINEAPPSLEGPGLSLGGTFPVFDLDRWRAAISPPAAASSAPSVASASSASRTNVPISSIRLNAVALDVGGKRFNDV